MISEICLCVAPPAKTRADVGRKGCACFSRDSTNQPFPIKVPASLGDTSIFSATIGPARIVLGAPLEQTHQNPLSLTVEAIGLLVDIVCPGCSTVHLLQAHRHRNPFSCRANLCTAIWKRQFGLASKPRLTSVAVFMGIGKSNEI